MELVKKFTSEEHQLLAKCSMSGYGFGKNIDNMLDSNNEKDIIKYYQMVVDWIKLFDENRSIIEKIGKELNTKP